MCLKKLFKREPVKKVDVDELARLEEEAVKAEIIEEEAYILWCLHKEFGFGPDRMKRFLDIYRNNCGYQYSDGNINCGYCYTQILKDYLKEFNIDLNDWQ